MASGKLSSLFFRSGALRQDQDMFLRELHLRGANLHQAAPFFAVDRQRAQFNNLQALAGEGGAELGFGEILVAFFLLGLPERLAQENRLGDITGEVAA